MGWQGDYTLDYNYEAPFWAAYPTNHMELTDNYDRVLIDHISRGLAIAARPEWRVTASIMSRFPRSAHPTRPSIREFIFIRI
jgi:hypothetical protein